MYIYIVYIYICTYILSICISIYLYIYTHTYTYTYTQRIPIYICIYIHTMHAWCCSDHRLTLCPHRPSAASLGSAHLAGDVEVRDDVVIEWTQHGRRDGKDHQNHKHEHRLQCRVVPEHDDRCAPVATQHGVEQLQQRRASIGTAIYMRSIVCRRACSAERYYRQQHYSTARQRLLLARL